MEIAFLLGLPCKSQNKAVDSKARLKGGARQKPPKCFRHGQHEKCNDPDRHCSHDDDFTGCKVVNSLAPNFSFRIMCVVPIPANIVVAEWKALK